MAAPQGQVYPLATFQIVDAPTKFAMKDNSYGNIHEYNDVRVQFNVFGNADQLSDCIEISGNIETAYKFVHQELEDGVTQIWCQPANNRIQYFEGEHKVWHIITDMIFKIGN